MRIHNVSIAGMLGVVLALSGCSRDLDVPPAVTDGESSSVTERESVREVTRELGGNTFTVIVRSVESDGTNLEVALGIRVAIMDEGNRPNSLNVIWGSSPGGYSPNQLRIVDFEKSEVLQVGSDDRSFAVNQAESWGSGNSPEEVKVVAYFAAPQSDRVSIMMPSLGMINDLEITPAKSEFTPPKEVDALSAYSFGRSAMQTLERPYESESIVRIEEETVTIAIPSDILFSFGSSELTDTAAASIGSVEQSIRTYAADGKLTVVGHTDDQGDDSINDPLSLGRAQAVAGVLEGILDDHYSIAPSGVGSREPAVAGTSEEARVANRRVEIVFEFNPEGKRSEQQIELPEAPEAVGLGNDPFTTKGTSDKSFQIQMERVDRHAGYLVGSLRVTSLASNESFVWTVFTVRSRGTDRSYDYNGALLGAANVAMLTSAARVFPVDYQLSAMTSDDSKSNWRVLADRALVAGITLNTAVTVTVVWPDPGTDTVTVEAEGLWRIMDVPVENASKN